MDAETTTSEDEVAQTLVGISFEDVFRAREFMTAAGRLASKEQLTLVDAVLIVADDEGRTTVTETTDPQPGRSAFSGAVWAGLFGLMLGGPVGWVAGLAAGAGAGAVAAKVIDLGISDDWVDWFRSEVKPNKAIVALLVTDLREDALVAEAARFTGSKLVYANLSDATVDRLANALGDATGPEVRVDPS